MKTSTTKLNSSRLALQAFAGKYREVILSILLFILLDLGVLILNYYISFQIQGDAVAVNLSGRQRMLSQRTTKVLYQLKYAGNAGKNDPGLIAELQNAYQLFDKTLQSFAEGGTVTGGDGREVKIQAITDPAARKSVSEAQAIWADYRSKVEAVLDSSSNPGASTLNDAIAAADANNLKLLKLMNELTTTLEHIAQRKGGILRTIQTVAIVLVLINFAVIMIHVIGKLKRSDEAIDQLFCHRRGSCGGAHGSTGG